MGIHQLCLGSYFETQGGSWPFWNKILGIRQGDVIIHLRGKQPRAQFIGYSIASGDGFETTRRPPEPKEWDFAKTFYRADLSQFTPFHHPVNLSEIFQMREEKLSSYFYMNQDRGPNKLNLFYVRQAGRLQCLNGAYLSDVDDDLLETIFGSSRERILDLDGKPIISVQTGTQLASVRARQGQFQFSAMIKQMYGYQCCFPGCDITDPRFLVGAHIARWSDCEKLRGHAGNGLCFCLQHDKAFEIGLFTLDENYNVYVNPRERDSDSPVVRDLIAHHGEQITLSDFKPLDEALLEHWIRVDIEP